MMDTLFPISIWVLVFAMVLTVFGQRFDFLHIYYVSIEKWS